MFAITDLYSFTSLQIPKSHMPNYIAQVLGVIVALLEDPDESVQLTAVQCLLSVRYLCSTTFFLEAYINIYNFLVFMVLCIRIKYDCRFSAHHLKRL